MKVFAVLCCLSAIWATSSGVVFKPCELVETLKAKYATTIFDNDSQLFPIIVCIAGYRNYNTSYRLENPKNNTGYYGIFGLNNNDVNRTACAGPGWSVASLLDDDIENDLRCLKEIVLKDTLNLKFYRDMCSPSMVRNVPCPVTNYFVADVFDPIDKTLFEKAFKKGSLPIPPQPPATTPAPCCCGGNDSASKYWAFYITVPAILFALAYFGVKIVMKRRREQQGSSLIDA